MKIFLYALLFSFYSMPLIVLSSDKSNPSDTAEFAALQKQAAQWAQKIVAHGIQQEVIDCANCVYLSLYVIKLDKKIRTCLATMLSLVGRLKLASNQYEPTTSLYDALRCEVEHFSTVTDKNKIILKQWQACTSHCQQVEGSPLYQAIQELRDNAALATVAWSLTADNPVARLANQVHEQVAFIHEKIGSIATSYRELGMTQQTIPHPDTRPVSLDDISMAESFADNCQYLSMCGLTLLQVAQEGSDGIAGGLQSASATVFLAYYTELFKTYKERYGSNANIPFTFTPYKTEDVIYLPDPAQKNN